MQEKLSINTQDSFAKNEKDQISMRAWLFLRKGLR